MKGLARDGCFFFNFVSCLFTVVPVAASVSADETEALKAEITKAVEKVQEAGKTAVKSLGNKYWHLYLNNIIASKAIQTVGPGTKTDSAMNAS